MRRGVQRRRLAVQAAAPTCSWYRYSAKGIGANMATVTKEKLSGSTDARGIKIVAIASAGTTIHTAHATAMDEIYLWAYNSDTTVSRLLTIQFGGTTSVDDDIKASIPPQQGL